jgi:DNA-binding NarL/FixJ family response regulator
LGVDAVARGVSSRARVALEHIEIVGEAGDGRHGIDGIARSRPDVAIVDLKMPGMTGLAAIPEILKVAPKTSILVFTMYNNPV